MGQENNSYNVALRYTRKVKGYHGVITWTTFSSKEDFDKWYTPEISARQKVVEEGITQERAIELAHQTPLACRMAAAIQEATDPDGNINQFKLEMEQHKAILAERTAQEYEAKKST